MASRLLTSRDKKAGTIHSSGSVREAQEFESQFLEGLTPEDRDMVVAAASRRHLRANSVAVHQGDPADFMFLLFKGRARHFYLTPEGKKIVLFWLAPGQIFGASALLSAPAQYLVGTEILKDSCLLVWRRSEIRALAARVPRLLDNAIAVANDYLIWYLAAHTSLVSHTAERRLAQVLTTLARGFGHKVPGGTCLDLTNEQLANAANVTIFTASRVLNSWQRKGAVVKTRRQLLLRQPEQLFPVNS
jgi:CRP/FNR family transcriptional regulator, nitrogen oxide reductase regulator